MIGKITKKNNSMRFCCDKFSLENMDKCYQILDYMWVDAIYSHLRSLYKMRG